MDSFTTAAAALDFLMICFATRYWIMRRARHFCI
jgi:hypothetical protein